MLYRDGTEVKSNGYSYGRPGFHSQNHMVAHNFPVPGDPVPSSDLHKYQTCTCYTGIHATKPFTYIK